MNYRLESEKPDFQSTVTHGNPTKFELLSIMTPKIDPEFSEIKCWSVNYRMSHKMQTRSRDLAKFNRRYHDIYI